MYIFIFLWSFWNYFFLLFKIRDCNRSLRMAVHKPILNEQVSMFRWFQMKLETQHSFYYLRRNSKKSNGNNYRYKIGRFCNQKWLILKRKWRFSWSPFIIPDVFRTIKALLLDSRYYAGILKMLTAFYVCSEVIIRMFSVTSC